MQPIRKYNLSSHHKISVCNVIYTCRSVHSMFDTLKPRTHFCESFTWLSKCMSFVHPYHSISTCARCPSLRPCGSAVQRCWSFMVVVVALVTCWFSTVPRLCIAGMIWCHRCLAINGHRRGQRNVKKWKVGRFYLDLGLRSCGGLNDVEIMHLSLVFEDMFQGSLM